MAEKGSSQGRTGVRSSGAASRPDDAEARERSRSITKLFALFPQGLAKIDVDFRLEAYLEELAEVPLRYFRIALKVCARERGRVFCPSTAEIRTAANRAIFEDRRRIEQRTWYSPTAGEYEPDPDENLAWARRNLPAIEAACAHVGELAPEAGRRW